MQGTADHFGQMAVNTTQIVNGKTYYFGADGKMVANTTIGGTQYGADGVAVRQETKQVNNTHYNINATDGLENMSQIEYIKWYANLHPNDPDAVKHAGSQYLQTDGEITKYLTYVNSGLSTEDEIIALVNKVRRENGLNELIKDNSLMDLAQIRLEEIPISGFSHTRPDGTTVANIHLGENLATDGDGSDAAYAMALWMTSSGHRANILNNQYTRIGVGHSHSNIADSDLWVQIFGL